MKELSDGYSRRQQKIIDELPDSAFEGHRHGVLEEYGADKERFADRINNSNKSVLDRIHLLTNVFERRKDSILKHIRSTQTKNLASVTIDNIKDEMQKYEEWARTQEGVKSHLGDYFQSDKEVLLANGLYHFVPDKEAFFEILANSIHEDLFTQTEFFKNVSGVFATREAEDGKTEVLLVRSAKYGIWQFPGGKAEHVCDNPETGNAEVVTKDGEIWRFENGKEAQKDDVKFETPEECLRREISEELKEDVGSVSLNSSGFYSIGNSRFLIHGFVANNLTVDPGKVNPAEIDRVIWTNDPFSVKEDDGVTPIRFTDQTKNVLKDFFKEKTD